MNYFQAKTHVASRLCSTSGTHHGGLDTAAPPAWACASLVVHHRKVGLFKLRGQTATSYTQCEKTAHEFGNILWKLDKITTIAMRVLSDVMTGTHWRCVPIQWCNRSCCGAKFVRMEAKSPAGRRSSGWLHQTDAAGRCHSCVEHRKTLFNKKFTCCWKQNYFHATTSVFWLIILMFTILV